MAITTQLRELVDGFSELTAQHLRLAKIELAEDAKYLGLRFGVLLVLAQLVLVGYGFLCAALAWGLAQLMPAAIALTLVGLLNVIAGAIGIRFIVLQLKNRKVMPETLTELQTTSSAIVHRGEGRS